MCNFFMFSSVLMFFSEVRADFTKIRTTFVKHDYLPACVCAVEQALSIRAEQFLHMAIFHKRWRWPYIVCETMLKKFFSLDDLQKNEEA